MKLLLILLLIGQLQYNRTCCSKPAFNGTQLSSLQPVISRYCPKITSLTCDGETEGILASHCCSGCSCKPSCGLTGNCCYKEDSVDKLDEERIRCMLPSTKDKKDVSMTDLPMYKFVVGPPVGGCVAEGSCNSSEQLIPWKTFYPVYSRSKKLNYISEECAGCHGVIDGIKWISIVSFLTDPTLNGLFENLSTDKSPRKYLLFIHPGNESENIQGICSSNPMDSCPRINNRSHLDYDIAKIFGNLNVSAEDFENGCLNGPNMPIFYDERVFKNIFCILCSRVVAGFENCMSGAYRNFYKGFTAIIDMEFIRQISEASSFEEPRAAPIACRVGTETNNGSCRPVLCPTMQLRTDMGECTFPSKSWLIPSLSLTLNLTTFNSKSVDILLSNLSDNGLLAAFYRHSPWNRCWKIEKIGLRSYIQHEHGGDTTEFILLMRCNSYEKNPTLMIKSVQQSLSQTWVIETNAETVGLSQAILAVGPPIGNRNLMLNRTVFLPIWYDKYERDVSAIVSLPHWEILFSINLYGRSFSLNRPFLCSQISLKADEYDILFTPFLIIRLISSERLLFESEIVVRRISDDKREIQICLEDSDFEIISNKVEGQHCLKRTYLLWLVFIKLVTCMWD